MNLTKEALAQHVANWSARLPKVHGWWPRFVYHFTELHNAVHVLEDGVLLSRSEAEATGRMLSDNASGAVIAATASAHKTYARLYFRPRTPTQFHNEGVRPRALRSTLGAHCPVPVFFFFDTVSVLGLGETLVSDGNVARAETRVSGDASFFASIPFADVFSDGGMGDRVRELTSRRQAEVLVPRLPLSGHLKLICCRSVAERQTLLHLLGPERRTLWEPYVRVASEPIFERRATYVESTTIIDDTIRFEMNPATRYPGPFEVNLRFAAGGRQWEGTTTVRSLAEPYSVRLPGAQGFAGILTLRLDGDLVYAATTEFAPATLF